MMWNDDSTERLKKFVYFANYSTTKEYIHSVEAYTLQEAINIFASRKNLSFCDFLKIYSVEEKIV